MTSVLSQLQAYLPPAVWEHLQQVRHISAPLGYPLYLVGGLVRDVLLNRPSVDLDVVVEGSAMTLAEKIYQQLGGELVLHGKFGTATWQPAGGDYSFDFITARQESYAHPGALPQVTPSHLTHDLQRRDFSFNTLAIRLDGVYLGQIIDQHNGRAELEAGLIRVLHPLSFVDDATRIWRGIRYEQRLNFAFEPQTWGWLEEQKGYLTTISGDRLRHELERVWEEEQKAQILARLDECGVLAYVAPGLHWVPEVANYWHNLPSLESYPAGHKAAVWLALWLVTQTEGVRRVTLESLRFPKLARDTATQLAEGWAQVQAAGWQSHTRPSEVAQLLQPYAKNPLTLLALQALAKKNSLFNQLITHFIEKWQHIRPELTGDDLRQWGIPAGAHYRQLLEALWHARLDGVVHTRAEEENLLKQLGHEWLL